MTTAITTPLSTLNHDDEFNYPSTATVAPPLLEIKTNPNKNDVLYRIYNHHPYYKD